MRNKSYLRIFPLLAVVLFLLSIPFKEGRTQTTQEDCEMEEIEEINKKVLKWIDESMNYSEDLRSGLTKEQLINLLESGKFSIICSTSDEDIKTGRLSVEDEKLLTSKLVDYFRSRKLSYLRILGKYDGLVNLYAYLVLNTDRKEFYQLGLEFNQAAVIYSQKGNHFLEYTDGPHKGTYNFGQGWEEVRQAKDNYTFLRTSDGHLIKFCLKFDYTRYFNSY